MATAKALQVGFEVLAAAAAADGKSDGDIADGIMKLVGKGAVKLGLARAGEKDIKVGGITVSASIITSQVNDALKPLGFSGDSGIVSLYLSDVTSKALVVSETKNWVLARFVQTKLGKAGIVSAYEDVVSRAKKRLEDNYEDMQERTNWYDTPRDYETERWLKTNAKVVDMVTGQQ